MSDGEEISDGNPISRKRRLLLVFISFGLLAVNWLLSSAALWWAYDMTPLIRGNFYTSERALDLVRQMGLIITSMVTVGWLVSTIGDSNTPAIRQAWNVCWKTAVLLLLYATAIIVRRMLWGPSNGFNDNAMFFPILGRINAAFFSEVGWMIFILEVVPIMSCVSAILYWLLLVLEKRFHGVE